MKTISFFAAAGGCGRTTVALALANAWMHLGERIVVIDATRDVGRGDFSSAIHIWAAEMARSGVRPWQLLVMEADSAFGLNDLLASAKDQGYDRVLIDTGVEDTKLRLNALIRSDAVICPLPGVRQARQTAASLPGIDGIDVPFLGLMFRLDGPALARERAGMPAAWKGMPFLRSTIGDRSEFFMDVPTVGYLPALVDGVRGGPRQDPAGLPAKGYDRFREGQRDWARLLALAAEIDWALAGQVLRPVEDLEFADAAT